MQEKDKSINPQTEQTEEEKEAFDKELTEIILEAHDDDEQSNDKKSD